MTASPKDCSQSPTNDRQDGTLRDPAHPLRPARGNIIVPRAMIRDLRLRPGLLLKVAPHGKVLDGLESIEGKTVDQYIATIPLYEATAMDPEPVMKLEHDAGELTTRIIDILTPVGFGQRGLIVAPPRSGKTILMQNMAKGIAHNYPDVELVLLLIDERPEEVTDMRRKQRARHGLRLQQRQHDRQTSGPGPDRDRTLQAASGGSARTWWC